MDKQEILIRIAEAGPSVVSLAPVPADARRTIRRTRGGGVVGTETTRPTPDAASEIADTEQGYSDGVLVGAGALVTHARVTRAAEASASCMAGLDFGGIASILAAGLPAVVAGRRADTEVVRGAGEVSACSARGRSSTGVVAAGAGSEPGPFGGIGSGDFAGIRQKGRGSLAAVRGARDEAAPGAPR